MTPTNQDGHASAIQFYDGGVPVPDNPVANIFAFCVFMAAAVASRRGGKTFDYIPECHSFMTDVIGKRLSVSDPLPDDYDWRPSAAAECADAMMEYDT